MKFLFVCEAIYTGVFWFYLFSIPVIHCLLYTHVCSNTLVFPCFWLFGPEGQVYLPTCGLTWQTFFHKHWLLSYYVFLQLPTENIELPLVVLLRYPWNSVSFQALQSHMKNSNIGKVSWRRSCLTIIRIWTLSFYFPPKEKYTLG